MAQTEGNDILESMYDFSEFCENRTYGTLAVFNISFTLLGLVSGAFLILIIRKNVALRGDKFLFLNNLIGAAMVLLAITGFIYTEEAINPCWYVGNFLCKIIHFSKTLLANASTFLLVALAIQQLNRYRYKLETVFNSTHTRLLITVIVIWGIAVVISIPELVLSEVLYFEFRGVFTLCGVFRSTVAQNFTRSAKILFFEYITPFAVLAVVVIITGFYVCMVKSQYTTFGVTTGPSLVTRDLKHPRHFGLIATLAVVYIIGYFPIYSYELASFLEGLTKSGYFQSFWLHMDLVSTFFVLVPPALVPVLIMCLSWPHREVVKEIYRHITVKEDFDKREEEDDDKEGEIEETDVKY